MKKLMTMMMLLGSLVAIQSCSKDGEVGPQGPKGDKGDTGATGQNGVSGTKAFLFGSTILPATLTLPVNDSYADSCAILVYYRDQAADDNGSTLWYQAPGLGYSASYQTRYYIQQGAVTSQSLKLSVHNPDGSLYSGSAVTFSAVRVIFVPAMQFGKKAPVDYSDYKATMKYYGLSE